MNPEETTVLLATPPLETYILALPFIVMPLIYPKLLPEPAALMLPPERVPSKTRPPLTVTMPPFRVRELHRAPRLRKRLPPLL